MMKKISRKFISLVLTVLLILPVIPLTVSAETTVKYVSTAEELTAACNTINEYSGADPISYTINLTADIDKGDFTISNPNAVVTVFGNGHTISCTTFGYSAIVVTDGATVNLGSADGGEKNVLTIKSGTDNDDPGIVFITRGSTCNMYDGVTLKDHKGNNYIGGGVTVEGGTFKMYGGTIENCGIDGGSLCYGGGVAVYAGGTFVMDGGTISNCYAKTEYTEELELYKNCYAGMGGGVFVSEGSVFTMNGGTITHNTATNFGGGVAMTLADTEVKTDPVTGEVIINPKTEKPDLDQGNPRSRAAINGGTISENTAKNGAGIFASGLVYALSSPVATDPLGTGEQFEPGLVIDGGTNKAVEISSNNATDMGGGVLVIGLKDTRKAQIYNAQIKNNTATIGAGVQNYNFWTQLEIDGCTITGNAAKSYGGGVAAIQNKNDGTGDFGYTAIKNTTITGNTSGDRGAGVYYDIVSEIRISGKDIIQDNTFNGKKNNLNILSLEKPVIVIGDLTGSQIGLSDPTLWDDDKEDIAADAVSTKLLTDGFKANNASLIPANAFTSDHESWIVDYGDKSTVITKTYKYSAKKYLTDPELTEGSLIKKNGYDYYIDFDAEALAGENVQLFAGPIYDVIYERFCQNYGEPQDETLYYQGAPIGYLPVFHDTRSGYYIGLIYVGTYNIYIQIGTDVSIIQNYRSYNISFIQCAGNVQNLNGGKTGKLVMKLNYYDPDYDPYLHEFSTTYSDLVMEYDEPLTADKTEYYANDIGVVSAKIDVDKSSETEIPHETVLEDNTNEVRLVRVKPNYHINNTDIATASYGGEDLFTSHVVAATKEIKVGEKIESFYLIPEVKPTADNSCPYIFKGWYYDPENDNDTHPVNFGTDKYSKDIYAHWIKVNSVAKDADDTDHEPPQAYNGKYGGFDLAGVQIREERTKDSNFGYESMPAGMRFVTSLSMDVVNKINRIQPNNIEYGYVAATREAWIDYHTGHSKLQYVSATANGINTTDSKDPHHYFDFASNINCTSKMMNSSGVVREDHRNFGGYLLYTLVITYDGDNGTGYDTKVLARPYIRYTDANGLERVAYSEYRGVSNTLGGCYTSYNDNV